MGRSGPSGAVTHRRVLNIALPIMLSNATVPILGAVDTTVIGQLGQAAPLAKQYSPAAALQPKFGVQNTHIPAGSQTFWPMHGVPSAESGWLPTPFVHTSSVHTTPASSGNAQSSSSIRTPSSAFRAGVISSSCRITGVSGPSIEPEAIRKRRL